MGICSWTVSRLSKDLQGSGHGLFQGTIPVFVRRGWIWPVTRPGLDSTQPSPVSERNARVFQRNREYGEKENGTCPLTNPLTVKFCIQNLTRRIVTTTTTVVWVIVTIASRIYGLRVEETSSRYAQGRREYLNKQSRTAIKVWFSRLTVGRCTNNFSLLK
jgi:hypothetical protein